MIFCGNVASVNAADAIRLNVIVNQDYRVAADFASFEPENPRYSLRRAGSSSFSVLSRPNHRICDCRHLTLPPPPSRHRQHDVP